MKFHYDFTIKLVGTAEPEQITKDIDLFNSLYGRDEVTYITGQLGEYYNVFTNIPYEPEREYGLLMVYHDGSEECGKAMLEARNKQIQIIEVNKRNSFVDTITVANIKTYKKLPNDYTVYVGRGNYPSDYNARCGNPFTVEQFGRGIALDKYVKWVTPDKLTDLANHLKTIKGKRIVLLCWCKPNPCHADTIKKILKQLGV